MSDSAELRARFAAIIQARGITVDPLWGRPCLGHNVFVVLPPKVQNRLREVQDAVLALAPDSLHTCPFDTLHITVAWILATPKEYARPKEETWARIAAPCEAGLQEVCRDTPAFTIRYTEVIATDTAVIAVATDDGSMERLRDAIAQTLPIPEETQNTSRIIHTTLFRYRAPLPGVEHFLSGIDALRLDIDAPITELKILKETVYPCLETKMEWAAPLQPVPL